MPYPVELRKLGMSTAYPGWRRTAPSGCTRGVARPRPAVRNHERRQVLRRQAFRQRQVRRNVEAVGRGVVHGLHRGERGAGQALVHGVLLVQRLPVPVVDVADPGLGVARGGHHPHPLVVCRSGKPDLHARQFVRDPAVVGLPGLVAKVDALPVADVDRGDQLAGLLGKDRAAEVHLRPGIRLDECLLPRLRVEEDQPHEVHVAVVRDHVDLRVVGVELHGAARLEHRAAVGVLESGRGDTQHLGVAVGGGAQRETQPARAVEHPAGDLVGVPPQQRPLARRDLHFVQVVPCRVAIVQTDEDEVGIVASGRRR